MRDPRAAAFGHNRSMTRDTLWHRIAGNRTLLVAVAVLCGTLAGGACHLLGAPQAGDVLWTATLAATIVPLAWTVVRALAHGVGG